MNNDELKELAAVLNGIADGKSWEWRAYDTNAWQEKMAGDCPITALAFKRKIRLKQWHLPDPPEGYEWHRADWTEEMLPDGWRPLLLGEYLTNGDELVGVRGWEPAKGLLGNTASRMRTRRPLPLPKPQLREVQLCADDIKAGDEFLSPQGYRYSPTKITPNELQLSCGTWLYAGLIGNGWKIRSIGETEWRKCSKMEEVPA